MQLKNNLFTSTGWEITEQAFDDSQIVTAGSNFLIGNGYLGYRGTLMEWGPDRYTACIVTDTYDQADGEWKELCNVPNPLSTRIRMHGEQLSIFSGTTTDYSRTLELKTGCCARVHRWEGSRGVPLDLKAERFASLENLHLLLMRCEIRSGSRGPDILTVQTGIQGEVWNLQGDHFRSTLTEEQAGRLLVETRTHDQDLQISVVEGIHCPGLQPQSTRLVREGKGIYRLLDFEISDREPVILEKAAAVYTGNDTPDPREAAFAAVDGALEQGYEQLRERQEEEWARIWAVSDIQIDGHLEDQTLTRFNLYHNIIATPTHAHLPIGARGLSTQVYQGAAFWDQEIFNLPMYMYTRPEVARNILEYRYRTLDGARHKARRLGYRGAFYAWTSGKTGRELFPDFFFTDVLTGRKIRNHFNDWQIHISPDISYAVWRYVQVTDDRDFLFDHGAEILFEVARFLFSHAYFKVEKNRFEFLRLLGPDEYHENVNNNAFTNYQAHHALQAALAAYDLLEEHAPDQLQTLADRIGLQGEEIDRWKTMAEQLYLPLPDEDTGLIEQFDGFFELEDIRPEELQERLIDPEEYWGWPNGIAVHAQVLKQADVVQLLALHDLFPEDVVRANYDYYEPRTEHGSSLSPSVHAQVACQAGYIQEAYRYFQESAAIDLYHQSKKVVSGGSFLGGIHTAACGAAWEIITRGFAGFRWTGGSLRFDPRLPESWAALRFPLIIRGHPLRVVLKPGSLEISSSGEECGRLPVRVRGQTGEIGPGDTLAFTW